MPAAVQGAVQAEPAGPSCSWLPQLGQPSTPGNLQENNAVATLDLASGRITAIHPLGFKDHAANPMDASDK